MILCKSELRQLAPSKMKSRREVELKSRDWNQNWEQNRASRPTCSQCGAYPMDRYNITYRRLSTLPQNRKMSASILTAGEATHRHIIPLDVCLAQHFKPSATVSLPLRIKAGLGEVPPPERCIENKHLSREISSTRRVSIKRDWMRKEPLSFARFSRKLGHLPLNGADGLFRPSAGKRTEGGKKEPVAFFYVFTAVRFKLSFTIISC
ncbi:hypothetical protein EVAR_12218_1 [Eumeta japonica]|uniref:Uncharacterized protein n=1 Tax=Eumeta variegata TaxID=151549 RepID=A0A4C1UH56_EUMVA|nr:hypothetical protein EVAR_12218_1 [Eumeta japonica]